ncbi:MAG: pyruvate dehydrogenase complex E1 component subunit beta [Chloroflexi bacterium]|nr:pyruvate dehydrogenase complex E1 component subunit beta [Chloroflexota bacterium]
MRDSRMAVITYREALNQALREEMRRDSNVFLMGEDIGVFEGAYKVTAGLLAEFGEKRVRDTPIAEEEIVGLGVGAAMVGLRPVVEMMTINFSLLAADQIVNHAAKLRYMFGGAVKIPMVVRMPEGGGHQLAASHSQSLAVWYAHIPGLIVVAPSTPLDAKGLLKTAIRDDNPIVFVENETLYNTRGEVPDGEVLTPIGKAEITRKGDDITIITHSRMLLVAMTAAKQLEEKGISVEVVDLRTLRPLDKQTVADSVRKTTRAVVLEEGWPTYGVSAEVAAFVQEMAFDYLDAPIRRIGGAEVPMPYAKNLEKAAIPDDQAVIAAVTKMVA